MQLNTILNFNIITLITIVTVYIFTWAFIELKRDNVLSSRWLGEKSATCGVRDKLNS